jgi:hypothetical protein
MGLLRKKKAGELEQVLYGFNRRVQAQITQYGEAILRNPDKAAYIQPRIESLNMACLILNKTIAEVAGV